MNVTEPSAADPTSAEPAAVVAKPLASLIGLVSAAAALAIGHLVAAFVGSGASPYFAVGNTAIDNTPSAVKDFAVSTFGTYDKLALLVGMAVVLVALAVLAGLVATRHALPGVLVIALFGVLGIIAVAARPDLGPLGLLAPLASLVAGMGTFAWLHRLAVGNVPAAAEQDGRRRFLVTGAGVVFGAGIAGLGGQYLSSRGEAEGSRTALGALPPPRAAPAIPTDADFAKFGTPPFLTSNQDFYRIDTALVVPQLRAQDWRLRIHGMVDRELTLTYADIRARQLVERTITLTCVSNEVGGPYISTANFLGVDLASLLGEAGVSPEAEQLYSTSADGFTCGTPIRTVLEPDRGAMLAIGMNSQPLPVEHGFPARMVIPGLYGYVSATKWVTDMEVTTWRERSAYWLDRGWAEQAPIKTQARIDVPAQRANQPAGTVMVAGIAWAQHTGIDKVEVRVDQGQWRPANLSTVVNDDTWRMWWIQVELPAGSHQLSSRATDKSGYQQTSERVSTVPDGATGWHTVTVNAA